MYPLKVSKEMNERHVDLFLIANDNTSFSLLLTQKLRDHRKNCLAFAAQCSEFLVDPIIKFKNVQNKFEASITVYADFEIILKRLSDGNKYQENIACSYAYKIASNVPGVDFDSRIYVGEDVVDHFLDT